MKNGQNNFSENLKKLEQLVKNLQQNDTSLEKQMEIFEKGVTLSKSCLKELDEVEKKIQLITEQSDGTLQGEDFSG